jgi:hypothetical protein
MIYIYSNQGLKYKPIMIVNDNSSIINKLETSLICDARVFTYDRHMFIDRTQGLNYKNVFKKLFFEFIKLFHSFKSFYSCNFFFIIIS